MMSPTVQFKHCGVRAVDMRADGKRGAVLGSLQWLNDHNILNLDLAILRNIETGGSAPADAALGEVSAVIMNPPFAVGQDGNTSFSFLDSRRDEEKMKKAYAERGRQYGFGSGSGAGPGFLQLAAKRVAEGGRFGTIIGVALGTGSKAYGRARRNLSRYFDIDTVIISRDPRRINFSDSTNLNELMVVGTRNDTRFVEKKDAPIPVREAASRKAAFVVLTRNPATPSKAKQLARLISNIDRSAPRGVIQGFGEYVMDEIRDAASWDILNFSNPDLSIFLRKASTGKTPAGAQPPGRRRPGGRWNGISQNSEPLRVGFFVLLFQHQPRRAGHPGRRRAATQKIVHLRHRRFAAQHQNGHAAVAFVFRPAANARPQRRLPRRRAKANPLNAPRNPALFPNLPDRPVAGRLPGSGRLPVFSRAPARRRFRGFRFHRLRRFHCKFSPFACFPFRMFRVRNPIVA